MKIISLIISFWIIALTANIDEMQIYCGEPFGEALHDIVLFGAMPISHQLSQASSTERTDAFRLTDGRILVISSVSGRLGEPYSINKILLGNSGDKPKKLKSYSDLKLSIPASSRKSQQ